MLIRVTAAHIEQGARCCSQRCMVALAIEDAIPGVEWVAVYPEFIRVKLAGQESSQKIIPSAGLREHIAAFDDGRPLRPFTFNLPIDHLVPAIAV